MSGHILHRSSHPARLGGIAVRCTAGEAREGLERALADRSRQ